MINIIIPIIDEKMIDFVETACAMENTFVIVGITESMQDKFLLKERANLDVKVFENSSKKEEIINSLQRELKEGSLIICRKAITKEELEEFVFSEKEIATCVVDRNKYSNFCFQILQKLLHFIFGFRLFNGDVSVVYLNEKMYPVFKNVENLSYITRINKWNGVECEELKTSSEPAKKEFNKKNTILMLACWGGALLALIVSFVLYLVYFNASFLAVLGFVSAFVILKVINIIAFCILMINLKAGKRLFYKAKIIKKEIKK